MNMLKFYFLFNSFVKTVSNLSFQVVDAHEYERNRAQTEESADGWECKSESSTSSISEVPVMKKSSSFFEFGINKFFSSLFSSAIQRIYPSANIEEEKDQQTPTKYTQEKVEKAPVHCHTAKKYALYPVCLIVKTQFTLTFP